MIALAVGTVLALAALAYVLYPLFADGAPARPGADVGASPEAGLRLAAVDALREIEFDRATGKLSDADYAALKAEYTGRAIAAMRAECSAKESGELTAGVARDGADDTADVADAAEAIIARYRAVQRACPTCGPRPEPDALYCSACGHFLPARCASCAAPVEERGARFCTACGRPLAAAPRAAGAGHRGPRRVA